MITFTSKGDFKRLDRYFERLLECVNIGALDKYGKEGVEALRQATPKDTGLTANCWEYEIKREKGQTSIEWHNTNIQDYVNIAVILQYGHGTKNGGFVEGVDYINPALKPIFEAIARDAWKEVTSA